MAQTAPTELGTASLKSLLKTYAVPGIIAQTAASLYNIVDSIYIGHIPGVGHAAISGLAVTFPLTNISVALGTLVGIGSMTMISYLLGQKQYHIARRVLSNTLTLNLIIGIVFSVIALIFLDPILYFFGASEDSLPFARDYMKIILIGNTVTHLFHGFNGIIRVSGYPKVAMGLMLFTTFFNIILDPILMFGLDMGIQGAAIATVACQLIALMYTFRFFSDKKRIVHFPRPILQLKWKFAKQSMAIGAAPFLTNIAACMVVMFINQQLRKYGGDLAIGSYGIANRFTLFFVMICFGFNQALQAIAGYNFGARQYGRVRQIFLLVAAWEFGITVVCFIVSMFFPEFAVGMFTENEEMIEFASRGLRHYNAGIAVVGFGIAATTFFQCLGMVNKAIFLSLTRQLILLVPLILILPQIFITTGFDRPEVGVWLSFPISDILSTLISAVFIVGILRKLRNLKDGDDPSVLGSNL